MSAHTLATAVTFLSCLSCVENCDKSVFVGRWAGEVHFYQSHSSILSAKSSLLETGFLERSVCTARRQPVRLCGLLPPVRLISMGLETSIEYHTVAGGHVT